MKDSRSAFSITTFNYFGRTAASEKPALLQTSAANELTISAERAHRRRFQFQIPTLFNFRIQNCEIQLSGRRGSGRATFRPPPTAAALRSVIIKLAFKSFWQPFICN